MRVFEGSGAGVWWYAVSGVQVRVSGGVSTWMCGCECLWCGCGCILVRVRVSLGAGAGV